MQLDVTKSAVLSAAVQVMATMPREAAKAVRKYSKVVIQPEWRRGLSDRAPAARMFHERLASTGAAYVSDRGVKLKAGAARSWPRETEFGAAREAYTTYTRRKVNGGTTQVRRRTQRQFWHYNPKGYVVYPTARDMIPRIASLWVQTIYRSVATTIERLGR